ncbi:MAG: trypsin-like peptidase domain-containing protein [Kiritimatiellae bacterium]|nr:trypsin-like peptidase domain-containing protein [Kiritimatiellia bacterium]
MNSNRSPLMTLTLIGMVVFLALHLKENRRRYHDHMRAITELNHKIEQAGLAAISRPAADMPRYDTGATDLYKRVSPSVVAVANHALVRRGFFGFQIYEVPQGAGSGFVWDKSGHIVSNYHVVHQASTLTVTFPDGSRYEAKLVGIAPDYDLAVLQINAPPEKLIPVELAVSRDLEVGQPVYAIGNPFGLDTTLSSGIVSALGRTITSMTDRRISDVIQTDAAINPGNSGGPLLDSQGLLVGVNTAILSPSGAYAGIGFAVPADTVARVIPQLIEKGRITRAGLGVELLPDHVTARAGISGVALYAVYEQTPAARAGLEGIGISRLGALVFGDVITAVDTVPVRTVEDLRAILDPRQPGERITLTVVRAGVSREVNLTLIEEP